MTAAAFKVTIRGVSSAPREYECPTHGPFEIVVDLATSRDPRPCPACAAPSERTLTANIVTHVAVGMFRGKADEKPGPLAMDTRPLAEGKVSLKEFRAQRRALHRDRRRARAKERGIVR